MEQEEIKNPVWYGYWVLGTIVIIDCLITLYLYEKGLVSEGNPIERWGLKNVPAYLALKAILSLIGLWWVWRHEAKYRKLVRKLMKIVIIIYPILFLIVFLTTYQLSRS